MTHRIWAWCCLLLAIMSASCAPASAQLAVVEDGVVKQGVLDLGVLRIRYQDQTEASFSLRNTSDSPITVQRVELPCGCITAEFDARDTVPEVRAMGNLARIPAGGTVNVRLEINLHRVPEGLFDKTIRVFVVGKEVPAATLTLRARIVPPLRFEPARIDFGTIAAGETKEIPLTVERDWDGASPVLAPKLISSAPESVRVQAIGTPESDVKIGIIRQRFMVSLAPDAPIGLLDIRLRSERDTAATEAPVTGVVTGSIAAEPLLVAFGTVAGAADRERIVQLTAKQSGGLQGLRVSTSAPWLIARLEEAGSGDRQLRVRLSADAPVGERQGSVQLSLASGKRLVLPVTALVSSSASPNGLSVGQKAPAFRLPDLEGKPHSFPDKREQAVALFFFCGCEACANTATDWGRLQRGAALNDTQTVIVYHEISPEGIRTLARDAGLPPERTLLLRDTGAPGVAASLYGAPQCPRVFVLDRSGVVRYTNMGADDGPDAKDPAHLLTTRALDAVRER